LDDLIAYQRAVAFKAAVYAVLDAHPATARDLRYRSQVRDAAAGVEANIAEAWGRRSAGEIRLLLSYALGSLFEAERRLLDGVARVTSSATTVSQRWLKDEGAWLPPHAGAGASSPLLEIDVPPTGSKLPHLASVPTLMTHKVNRSNWSNRSNPPNPSNPSNPLNLSNPLNPLNLLNPSNLLRT
jgi:four helix bundle protein